MSQCASAGWVLPSEFFGGGNIKLSYIPAPTVIFTEHSHWCCKKCQTSRQTTKLSTYCLTCWYYALFLVLYSNPYSLVGKQSHYFSSLAMDFLLNHWWLPASTSKTGNLSHNFLLVATWKIWMFSSCLMSPLCFKSSLFSSIFSTAIEEAVMYELWFTWWILPSIAAKKK